MGFILLSFIYYENMLIRFIFFFYLYIFCAYPKSLKAQNLVEFNVGHSYNNLHANLKAENFSLINQQIGYYFSILYRRRCFNKFYVKTGIEAIQKKYLLQKEDDLRGVYELHNNMYLQFPLNFQLKIIRIKNLDMFFNSGFFGGYWIMNKIEGCVPNAFDTSYGLNADGKVFQNFSFSKYSLNNEFNSIKDNRIELGINVGWQLEYPTSGISSLVLGLNYFHSFTDQQKQYMIYQILQRNQTLVMTIGINFKINNEKL